jgi:hypothetical protein
MEQIPSWVAKGHSASQRNSSPFMEPESSLPSLQQPATGPNSGSD